MRLGGVWEVEFHICLSVVFPQVSPTDPGSKSLHSYFFRLQGSGSHCQGFEEMVVKVFGEGESASLLHEIAGDGVHGVAVDVLCADRCLE